MTKTSKKIVFFGNERLATGVQTDAPTLQALIAAGYHVAAVVSNFEVGQSRKARQLEIAEIAKANHIPLLLPANPAEIKPQLQALKADVGVLVAYGKIVPQSVIDIFPQGIINIHPSLLPKHRGPTPLESVILDGSQQTGVSIMALSSQMDAGPIYAQQTVMVGWQETKQQLADNLLNKGGQMLLAVLPAILEGKAQAGPQDEAQASYDSLIVKADGIIDWHKPAVQLEREVRAYTGWPRSRTTLLGTEVIITQAQVSDQALGSGQVKTDNQQLVVGCGVRSLVIDKLQPAGKTEMTAQAFLAGNRQL
ncbi:MAG: methionyl-tRNA formyltransferase [Candidatus Saccharimonadales bacterium]